MVDSALSFERVYVSPKEAVVGIDLEPGPGAGLELEAKSWLVAVLEDVFVLQSMKRQELTHAAGLDLYYHILPGSLLQGSVLQIHLQGESMIVDLLL